MRNIARYVVDTHCHITTLYQPEGEVSQKLYDDGLWTGLNGLIVGFDNSDFTVRDMDRYGVDMAVLLPSMLGCNNAAQIAIMDKYPGRFAACCCDGDTLLKYYQDKTLKYKFEYSLDEIEAALKTGRFSGIGEFAPGLNTTVYELMPKPTMEERMEQWKAICDIAAKYDVPVHYHDFILPFNCPNDEVYDYTDVLHQILTANPKAKIIASHGGKDPIPPRYGRGLDLSCRYDDGKGKTFLDRWNDFYTMAANTPNLYIESGGWCEKNFEVAFDCGMTAARITWGHDYGNVPQYLFRKGHLKSLSAKKNYQFGHVDGESWNYREIDSTFGGLYEGVPPVPTYQSDFYGWGMRVVDRVGDWLTQDEINLIMGGSAARLFKLPVPYARMFPEARPDIFGDNWKEEWYPFIPDNQIMTHDYDADGNILRLPTDC